MMEDNVRRYNSMKDVLYDIKEENEKDLKDILNITLEDIHKVVSSIKPTPILSRQKCEIFLSKQMFDCLVYEHPVPTTNGDFTLFGYKVSVDEELGFSEFYLKTYIK